MNTSLKKELPLLAIVLLPFVYLAYIWAELPDQVPVHWNIEGEIDRYGTRYELLGLPFLITVLPYLIFLIVPYIDPKGKLKNMGNKLHQIKVLMTIVMSVLALFLLYAIKHQSIGNPNYILLIIGVLYVVMGNYFQTIKPNYFIGIRTPWTLQSETVWKATHKLGGRLWFGGGLLVIIGCMVLPQQINLVVFLIITAVMTLIPLGYSYRLFKTP